MTLQECYAGMGADYQEAVGRLRSERLIQKFALKFLDDGSYQLLKDSVEAGNWPEAFRAAHTIKGVCQNLSFTPLANSASALTEALRNGKSPEADALYGQVQKDYAMIVEHLKAVQATL